MKFSELWLREWVNPKLSREALSDTLTMAGLEVDELTLDGEDYKFDVAITPNRGDCLSIQGIARDIAAITKTSLIPLAIHPVPPAIQDTLPIKISSPSACPRYAGRIIRNINSEAVTPPWLAERLRLSDIKSISPVVDVTNYVMLELGQPMHAFDLNTIHEGIEVRNAGRDSKEKIKLLDESEKTLDADTLIIADHQKPLAIAGIMGGLESSVTLKTKDIFLESAYFSADNIVRQRRLYGLNSESCYRFERGVDPELQVTALERATQLILEISGGQAGPITEVVNALPKSEPISLSSKQITAVLGIEIPEAETQSILNSLGFTTQPQSDGWIVNVPSYRFDMAYSEDLIEEVARLYGYDNIPVQHLKAELAVHQPSDVHIDTQILRECFSHQGYHEIVTYSFVSKPLQTLLDPDHIPQALHNPMTAEMAVMRTNMWPGLVSTLISNQSRQQHRVWLFEIGACFVDPNNTDQPFYKLGGIASNLAFPEQWGLPSRKIDFFDIKNHLENSFKLIHIYDEISFKAENHPALHPGQAAAIYHKEQKIGIIGALHPTLLQTLDLSSPVFVFEIDLNTLPIQLIGSLKPLSKFPEIRRDLAILVDQAIPSKVIQDTIKNCVGGWLKDVFIFDVYQGKGVASGLKSVAMALILQHPTRTLVDDEINGLIDEVVATLKRTVGAELRS